MRFRLILLLCMLCCIGCDGPQSPSSRANDLEHPAEKSFAWIMQRLQHIIDMQDPPSSLGLRLRYELSHKLIPPPTKQDPYRAEVTIVSKARFLHRNPSPDERQARAKKKAPPQAESEQFDFPASDPTGSVEEMPDLNAGIKRPQPAAPIKPQEVVEKTVIMMEYQGDQWTLLTEPEEEVERTWFAYALQLDPEESLDEASVDAEPQVSEDAARDSTEAGESDSTDRMEASGSGQPETTDSDEPASPEVDEAELLEAEAKPKAEN